jgi:hypothetical protein
MVITHKTSGTLQFREDLELQSRSLKCRKPVKMLWLIEPASIASTSIKLEEREKSISIDNHKSILVRPKIYINDATIDAV